MGEGVDVQPLLYGGDTARAKAALGTDARRAEASGGEGGKGGDDGVVAGGGAAEAVRAVDEVAVAG